MDKKKILYLITQGEWGGAQRYVFDLTTHLPDDFEVSVAIGEPSGIKDLQGRLSDLNRASTRSITIIQLNHLQRSITFFSDIRALIELVGLYKRIKPSIVHLNSSKAGFIGSIAAMLSGIHRPIVVYTVHGWVFNEAVSFWKKKFYQYLEQCTARFKDHFIVLSDIERKQAETALLLTPSKLTIIEHGITAAPVPLTKIEARNKL